MEKVWERGLVWEQIRDRNIPKAGRGWGPMWSVQEIGGGIVGSGSSMWTGLEGVGTPRRGHAAAHRDVADC